MKKFSILLAIVMLLTVVAPATLVSAENYQEARDKITFDTIKGTNKDKFNVTAPLTLPKSVESPAGTVHKVEWVSGNTAALSITEGEESYIATPNQGAVDAWAELVANVYHEDAVKFPGTYVQGKFNVRIPADRSKVEFLLEDDFEGKANGTKITSTTASDTDWYLSSADQSFTDFTYVTDDVTGENNSALKMTAIDHTYKYVWATRKLTRVPTSGIVVYNMKALFSGSSALDYVRPFWQEKGTATVKHPAGVASGDVFEKNFSYDWHHFSVVFDFDKNIATTYIDGYYAYTDTDIPSATKTEIAKGITMRLGGTSSSYLLNYVYIDDLEVKVLLANEAADLKAFNPATKGAAYVDANLAQTVTLNGASYPVTYKSSDETVIAADGTVTRPDFFRTVKVTPQVTIDSMVLSGTERSLLVLPQNASPVFSEDFTAASEGVLVNSEDPMDASKAKYNGWYVQHTGGYSSYADGVAAGVTANVVNVDNNKALLMNVPAGGKGYRLGKSIDEIAVGDVAALAIRVKNANGSGVDTFATSLGGLFSSWYGWRGEWSGNKVVDDYSSNKLQGAGKWRTYLFVFDKRISATETGVAGYPITLYIDGEYIGTNWASTAVAANFTRTFILNQYNHGAQAASTYVDDIMVFKINDSQQFQSTNNTVADGKLTHIGIQNTRYGTQQNLTAMLTAYNNGTIVGAKKIYTAPSAPATGDALIDIEDYTFPAGTTSYRIFLLESAANLRPLAVSKEFALN